MPRLNTSAICASSTALGAILSIWRSSPLGGLQTYRWRLRHLIFQQRRDATARERTRSTEGLGGPHPSSLGLALTIRIWGPGQSPAGAQRRTKATFDPAT